MEDQVPSSKQYVTPGQVPQENNYFNSPEGPRYPNPAEFAAAQQQQQQPMPDFQEMRRIALEQAIQQVTQQSQPPAPPEPQPQIQQQYVQPEPQVVYVRRNLTLAEIMVVLAISCGLVFGVQSVWNFATDVLPRIEIREN